MLRLRRWKKEVCHTQQQRRSIYRTTCPFSSIAQLKHYRSSGIEYYLSTGDYYAKMDRFLPHLETIAKSDGTITLYRLTAEKVRHMRRTFTLIDIIRFDFFKRSKCHKHLNAI